MRFKNILKRQRCRGNMIEEIEKEFKRIDALVEEISI